MNTVTTKLQEMIAAGRYDWVDDKINEQNFGSGTLATGEEPELSQFDRDTDSDGAIAEMDRDGYRPGTLGDLLVYGAMNLEDQRGHPIIALGSLANDGTSKVTCFGPSGVGPGRVLGLLWFGNTWVSGCRFLRVKK